MSALDQIAEIARTLPPDRRRLDWSALVEAAPSRAATMAAILRPEAKPLRAPGTVSARHIDRHE